MDKEAKKLRAKAICLLNELLPGNEITTSEIVDCIIGASVLNMADVASRFIQKHKKTKKRNASHPR